MNMKDCMNKKSRILFILHLPPPVHGAAMMGKYIHDSKIINESLDCSYINLALAKDMQDIGKGGIRKLFDFIKLLLHIRSQVKKMKPDLCYVTPNAKGGAFYKDFVVVMMLKVLGQKVVIHYHNKGVKTKQNKTLDNFLYKRFFKNLKVILLAEGLYQDVCKYVNRKDVYICPNGIPEQKDIPVRKSHKGFNVLFLSNMMAAKGVWDLVDACKILKDRNRNFQCHFVGKWSDISEEEFNNKIQEYRLDDIVFAHGAKYGNEKNEFFENTDCFVFPTFYHNECFPLVLLEAMEQEIACISTDEGGIRGIIDDNKTGYVVEKNNPLLLAEKLEYLMNNRERCMAMGVAGKDKFKKEFTISRFENNLKNILQEISNSK